TLTLSRRLALHARARRRLLRVSLLDYVRELVREQLTARRCLRRIVTGGECDVLSGGVRVGVHILRRALTERVCMNAHLREVVSESLLHVETQLGRERLAG